MTGRLVAACAVAFGAVVAPAQTAGAHAALVRSEPAASATVAEPPSTIRLWFKEAVVVEATVVEVARSEGAALPTRVRSEAGHPKLVVVGLPGSMADGVYVVRWRVLSDADGHVTQGVLAFGVGAAADLSTAVLDAPATIALPQDVVLKWLYFLTLAAVFGPLSVALAVLDGRRCRGLTGTDVDAARRSAQARLLGGALVAVGAAAAVGVAMAARDIRSLTSGSAGAGASVAELVFGTRWGALWLARLLALVVAAGCVIALRRTLRDSRATPAARRLAASTAAVPVIALAVIQALSGHAAAADTAPVFAVAADAAHLAGAACWIGGLGALAALGGLRRAGPAGVLAREAWRAFAPLAVTCVAVLAITGLYGMAGGVASLDAALTTAYGRSLLGKSVLFVAMGLVGLCSSAALHPSVAHGLGAALGRLAHRLPAPRQLRGLVITEAGIGVAILLLAALASASPPAVGPEFSPASATAPATRSAPAGDVLVSLSAYPNRPGENLLRVRATSTRRQEPGAIAKVLVRFASGSDDAEVTTVPLAPAGDGTYEGTTAALSQAGPWRAEVVVRRAGVEDSTVAFDWDLPVAAPRPRLVSNRPWQGLLETAVVVLAAAQALAVVLFVRRSRAGPRRPADDGTRMPVAPVTGGAHP